MADIELIVKMSEEMWKQVKDGYVPLGISKYLKRGIPLPLIKSEIEKQEKWLSQAGYNAYNVNMAFNAIKLIMKAREKI